jgi:hypothetical protein
LPKWKTDFGKIWFCSSALIKTEKFRWDRQPLIGDIQRGFQIVPDMRMGLGFWRSALTPIVFAHFAYVHGIERSGRGQGCGQLETFRTIESIVHSRQSREPAGSTLHNLSVADQSRLWALSGTGCDLVEAINFRYLLMSTIDKPKSPWLSVGGIAGAIVGFYCGLMLLIPLGIAFAAGAILKKIGKPGTQPLQIAAAVLIGHSGWMAMGLLVKDVSAMTIVPHMILMAIGLVWLFASPGRGVAWYLTIFEGVWLVFNFINLLQHPFGAMQHKALIAHLCLRIFVITSVWLGLRVQATPPPLPTTASPLPQ